ncbi:MAG: PEP-CTERM sorting domain-containing protein [Acidobacteriota bacterium]
MLKRTTQIVAVVAAIAWPCARADAATIVARPDQIQFGLPGATIGWGYEIIADPAFDLLSFTGIGADIFSGSGTVSVSAFDFPSVSAGATLQRDYDSALGLGLVELTLSPLLSPGGIVIGRVFGEYLLRDASGVLPDSAQSFEVFVTAQASDPSAVPEPATFVLVGTGLFAVVLRRRQLTRS